MMNTVTITSLHPMYECLSFLERSLREDTDDGIVSYDSLYESLQRKHLFDEKILKKKIRTAASLQKKVLKAVHLSKEDLEFYFKDYEDKECTIARDLCWAYIDFTLFDEQAIREKACSLVNSYGSRPFQMMCCSDETILENEEALQENFDFIGFLSRRKDVSSSDKWKMVEVSANIRYHLEHLLDILQPGISTIQKEKTLYKDIVDDFEEYLYKIVDNEEAVGHTVGIQSFCEEASRDSDSEKEDIITIIPCVSELNSVGWMKRDLFQDRGSIFFIGILLDESYHKENHLSAREELLQNLKLLSDNSKFEILIQLKKQAIYGQEISDRLKLSKATISHHMNALSSANFIKLREEKKRIYYTLNEEYIRNFLHRLEEELLTNQD